MMRRLATIALVASLALGGAVGPVTAASASTGADTATKDALVVDLYANGTATVTARYTYDLSSDAEQNAFEELRQNETLQHKYAETFEERMQRVANATAETVSRSMTVSNPTVDFRRVDGVGVVTFSVTWTNFAATENGGLVVSEPFAGGFDMDRLLVIRPPDGYTAASVTPTPDARSDGALVWTADATLENFRVVLTEEKTTTTATTTEAAAGTTTGGTPGFGVATALVALLGAFLVTRRD